MNTALVVGCGAGGAVIAQVLDSLAAKVLPTPPKVDPGDTQVLAQRPSAHVPSGFERFAVGVISAAALAAAAWRIGAQPVLAAFCVLFLGCLAVSVIDQRVGLIPKRFIYPTGVLVLGALLAAAISAGHYGDLRTAAIGGAISFAVFFAIWWIYPRGLGFGDVRLAAVIGLGVGWLGLAEVYVAFVVAFIAGAAFGLVVRMQSGGGTKTRFAFGPAMSVGAVVAVLWGHTIVHAWLHHGG